MRETDIPESQAASISRTSLSVKKRGRPGARGGSCNLLAILRTVTKLQSKSTAMVVYGSPLLYRRMTSSSLSGETHLVFLPTIRPLVLRRANPRRLAVLLIIGAEHLKCNAISLAGTPSVNILM